MNWIIGALASATFLVITADARRKQMQRQYVRRAKAGAFAGESQMDY